MPVSGLVRDFPVPDEKGLKGAVSFTQSLDDNLEIQYQSVSYVTTKDSADVKAGIDQWLKDHSIKCNFSSKTHTSTLDAAVRDIFQWETDRLCVSVRMHHEHSDDTSWIDATFWNRP